MSFSADESSRPDDAESDPLAARRKRLLFRAHHRGTKEADLVIGPFAASDIAHCCEAELAEFERILDLPDPDLYDWLIAGAPLPPAQDGPVMRRLLAFRETRRKQIGGPEAFKVGAFKVGAFKVGAGEAGA